MKIEFFGGVETVTGSQHLLTINNKKILLECGLFQGRRIESFEKNSSFPFAVEEIDYVLLSHAHLDHSGNIPNLVKNGFRGRILATPPTVDLCKILLKDSAFLQEWDLKYLNMILAKSDKPPLKPMYTKADVEATMKHFEKVEYDKSINIDEVIRVTFRDAGHILGSAGILLEVKEKGNNKRIGFTGDLGRKDTAVICDPIPLQDLDVLISETTYGNRHHSPVEDVEEELAEIVNNTVSEGGKILIPAFAVGRTQQVVYYLHKLFNQNRIPDIPVFVDSPLASKATEIFRHYPDYLDSETDRIFLKDNEDPFGFKRLEYVGSADESKKLHQLIYPHIIISASGMAEGGRILHHLQQNIENPKALILFVGYAAKHTLARKIMSGEKMVRIYGEEYPVKAKVKVLDYFSAHGDRRDLLNYVKFSPPSRLKRIFLVHGEKEQSKSLVDAFRSQGYENVYCPTYGSSYEL